MGSFSSQINSLIQNLFSMIWTWIIGPFKDLKSFQDLIFGKSNGQDMVYATFTTDQINNIILPGITTFQAFGLCAILIAVILAGMRISSSGINPSNRSYAIGFFKDLAIVTILFFNITTLYDMIFQVNDLIVHNFDSANQQLIKMASTINGDQDVLGNLLINLVLLGLSIWANFYYMMRSLTLTILMIIGPLIVALYLIPQTKGIFGGYIKEFVGTVFVQGVHAALYWIMAIMSVTNSGIEGVILYVIFIPVAESIRGLLGLGGQMNDRLSRAGAMFGMAGLAGVGGAIKGALNGQSVAQVLRGAAGQTMKRFKNGQGDGEEENSKGKLANAGTDSASTTRAERMLKAGDIMSRAGKAVFGSAGAIAGSALGPMGSMAGSTLGFEAGGLAGGLAGRTGMGIGETAFNRVKAGLKKGSEKGKGIWNAESEADEKLANAIADADTQQWASENKEAFMNDRKEKFPDAHPEHLNDLWDKEVAGKSNEFLTQARSKVGQLKKNDGQNANAQALVGATVSSLTNDWAKDNEEQFKKDYEASHPLPENATKEQISKHNQAKANTWKDTVDNKRNAIQAIAESTAINLSKGVPLQEAFINKNDFSQEVAKGLTNDDPSNTIVSHAAADLTNKWANKNKAQFMNNYDQHHPLPENATQEMKNNHDQAKMQAWNNEVAQKRDSISKIYSDAKQHVGNGTQITEEFTNTVAEKLGNELGLATNDDRLKGLSNQVGNILTTSQNKAPILSRVNGATIANAQMLSQTANTFANDWASANKEQFMNNYDQNHPLPENATPDMINNHNQAKSQAWNNEVAQKRESISKIFNDAKQHVMNGAHITEEFSNAVTEKVGNALGISSNDDRLKGISNQVGNALSAINKTESVLSGVNGASIKSTQLLSQTADTLTNDWAAVNKEQFMSNYEHNHPVPQNASQETITQHNQAKSQAWQQNLSAKRDTIATILGNAQSKVSSGTPVTASFSSEVVEQIGNALGVPANDEKLNAISGQVNTALVGVQSLNSMGQRSVLQSVNKATSAVNMASLYSRKSVNSPYLMNQLAGMKANEGKEAFIEEQTHNGISQDVAEQRWTQQQPQRIQENIRQLASSPTLRNIPLDHSIIQNKAVRGVSAAIGSVSSGVVGATGIKEISQFVSDTKIGQGFQSGGSTLITGISNFKENTKNGVVSGVGHIVKDSFSQGFSTIKTHVASDVVGKQAGFRNAVAYTFGTVAGVSGYKAGAKLAAARPQTIGMQNGLQWNPYNNAVNNQVPEISDISHMAQTVTDSNGITQMADGALQMVTTSNQTILQVRDKTGQVRTVSRINTGDSNLSKGETVYQDLSIQNGALSPVTNPYQLDSGGGKITLTRPINVNPNKLIANRNTPQNPTVVKDIQSYNQLVDSGQFTFKDIMSTQMSDMKMVIDRNRSYIVGTDSNGREHRISPYGSGDARLNSEQVIYTKCEVRNHRLVSNKDFKYEGSENSPDYGFTTSLSPMDLLPKRENPRNRSRRLIEQERNQSFTEPLTTGGRK